MEEGIKDVQKREREEQHLLLNWRGTIIKHRSIRHQRSPERVEQHPLLHRRESVKKASKVREREREQHPFFHWRGAIIKDRCCQKKLLLVDFLDMRNHSNPRLANFDQMDPEIYAIQTSLVYVWEVRWSEIGCE